MPAFWTEPDYDDHESVALVRDRASGLTAIFAIHSTHLGPAAGGMAEPHFEAVASLLHERAPREVSDLLTPSAGPPPQALRRRPPGLLRDVVPGSNALEPTHVLSNGRYHVSLRANGAGHSRWGAAGITRWRDDALRDQQGSFCYLRWDQQPSPVSITQHPAPDPAAHYRSVFHADRVCFDAAWPELQAHVTVWVSPEDDIEFRQIELRNLSPRTLDIELLSAFEVTLADARADEAHPAFSNLFVGAQWQPSHQALVFTRQPRLASEQGLLMAHFVAERDAQVVAVQVQTNRQRWIGRNRSVSDPLADVDALPAPLGAASAAPPLVLDTGLDPVCALAIRLRIAPMAKAQLTVATAASPDAALLTAVIDKYRQSSHVQRASLMSATLAGIRLRTLRVSAANFAALQSLTSALVMNLTRPQVAPAAGNDEPVATDAAATAAAAHELAAKARPGAVASLDRRALWRLGLSGDRALIVVMAEAMQSMGLLRTLVKGLALWSWGGVACDLVVVNSEAASYQMSLQRELISLRERYLADSGLEPQLAAGAVNSLHVLRADELSALELDTLQGLARITIHADGRPLTHHVDDWIEQHDQAMQSRHETSTVVVESPGQGLRQAAAPPRGRFVADSGAFEFEAGLASRPLRPWINVLANAQFGAHLSEAGGGYTWAGNSRLNQLTAWSNDPVCDPVAEWFLLQDRKTRQVWSVSASSQAGSAGDPVAYQVSHGQGHSVVRHRRGDLEITVSWCVDELTSIKHVHLRVTNLGPRSRALRLVGVAEWMMGAQRSDRSSVSTALHRQRLPDAAAVGAQGSSAQGSSGKAGRRLLALLCTQREQSAGFGGGTAFLSTVCLQGQDDGDDWTCDRRECFDARGRAVLPDHFGQRSGPGLDPCAALSVSLDLAAGQSAEQVFLIGYAPSADAARQLAATASMVAAADRLAAVQRRWDGLLGATQVKTPDPLFDAMVNRWLLYQTVSCRLWAKAGFYQAGGATGFRDQLQDALSLTWAAPELLREQILICASRQFAQGDVQHWWHSPGGAGVRTHFSDDLLWLAHACVHYLRATGDISLLDEAVPFIEGSVIPDSAEDVYDSPAVSSEQATVYEHAARAIDRSLKVGAHGLPLMGTGDWNDGMNRVGHQGRGESVWLAWFLCRLVADFTPLARARQEHDRASRWEQAALGWRAALADQAWDGQWYLRAFFDDGQALGSHLNAEARIDLIAQAWAVLSGAASDARQRQAMAAAQQQLMDPAAGLIRLLDPPLAKAEPSAGYIQAYPPGVRENGGQYTHAGVWALMALAELARRDAHDALDLHDQANANGAKQSNAALAARAENDANQANGALAALGRPADADPSAAADQVYRCFTWLNPAHRASHPIHGPAYGLEPYAVAGDVYSQPPRVGQGGWSWYTGAAAWLHRAAVESIFGLRQGAHTLSFTPCLPSHWPLAELTLVRGDCRLRFVLVRATAGEALAAAQRGAAVTSAARLLRVGEELDWRALTGGLAFVVPLLPAGASEVSRKQVKNIDLTPSVL